MGHLARKQILLRIIEGEFLSQISSVRGGM